MNGVPLTHKCDPDAEEGNAEFVVEVEGGDEDEDGDGNNASASPDAERAAVQQRLINLITSSPPSTHVTCAVMLT